MRGQQEVAALSCRKISFKGSEASLSKPCVIFIFELFLWRGVGSWIFPIFVPVQRQWLAPFSDGFRQEIDITCLLEVPEGDSQDHSSKHVVSEKFCYFENVLDPLDVFIRLFALEALWLGLLYHILQ